MVNCKLFQKLGFRSSFHRVWMKVEKKNQHFWNVIQQNWISIGGFGGRRDLAAADGAPVRMIEGESVYRNFSALAQFCATINNAIGPERGNSHNSKWYAGFLGHVCLRFFLPQKWGIWRNSTYGTLGKNSKYWIILKIKKKVVRLTRRSRELPSRCPFYR